MKRWFVLSGVLILTAIAVIGVTESSRRTPTVSPATPTTYAMVNLGVLGVALDKYAKEHQGRLPPPAVYDKDGRPLLSWRVPLLPYIERVDKADRRGLVESGLYEQFKLDEPWDSEHNHPLLERIPRIYKSPKKGSMPAFTTPYQVFVGKGTAFEGKEGVRLDDFPDGIETILIVEAAEGVPWTKPRDIDFEEAFPPLGNVRREEFLVLSLDTVRALRKDIRPATLRALITRNAGDDPGKDW